MPCAKLPFSWKCEIIFRQLRDLFLHTLRASLLLPHLPPSAVANLLRVAPERFTTTLLAQIFDATGSSAGRRNLARAICHLRNVRAKRKSAGDAEEV